MKNYLLIAISALAIGGCATPDIFNEQGSASTVSQPKDANIIHTTYKVAESLVEQAPYLRAELKPILITSVLDITDLNTSSALGLAVSEQIGNRLTQLGFPVVDLRTRHDVKVREKTGEIMLSRDVLRISKKYAAGAVLAGTYAVGKNNVLISTRLIRPTDNRVLATYDFELPLGPDANKLVKTKTPPTSE